ncbi:class I SAM-dependent methyltransferase [Brumimicrobium glaciale]|uniref:Class I SAM-dependent methyltransferase n=1 Tax=Brumimicrobium glaciale TaxID=200475 RepID=A0A4Q4KL71_9FLAO|nr:class I SAM-dependent methyltransferase [Brumimicrobium glaciale]RYM34015.1 class I SAM-dependent methyltransferase [Brumimicrobium glaciale]
MSPKNLKPVVRLKEKHVQNCRVLTDRYHLLKHLPKNSKGVEVGVLGGDWSEHLLAVTEPSELVLIDTFYSNDYDHMKRFTKKNHESYIKDKFSSHGEKVKVMKGLSWNMLNTFDENYFDWIYIDAAHDYNSVVKDLQEAYRVLKSGGIIIMNDYIEYDHFTKEDYGVVQATNEFMTNNNFEMLFFALHPNMFCDVMLQQIKD